jgi:hypothetical protein
MARDEVTVIQACLLYTISVCTVADGTQEDMLFSAVLYVAGYFLRKEEGNTGYDWKQRTLSETAAQQKANYVRDAFHHVSDITSNGDVKKCIDSTFVFKILTPVKGYVVDPWVMTPCSLIGNTNSSEERTAAIFSRNTGCVLSKRRIPLPTVNSGTQSNSLLQLPFLLTYQQTPSVLTTTNTLSLRLAVYSQSVRLGAKLLETHYQRSFFFN